MFSYLQALLRYLQTPKGRHDFVDYSRAILLIAISIAMVMMLVKFVCEK